MQDHVDLADRAEGERSSIGAVMLAEVGEKAVEMHGADLRDLQALVKIDELDPDFGVSLRLAATTGARRSQLCALRWSDVDLDARTITFARGIVDGGPGVGMVEKTTKSGQVWRVSIAPGTSTRLESYRQVCLERAAAARTTLPLTGFVFAVPPDGS
jgi:integrase